MTQHFADPDFPNRNYSRANNVDIHQVKAALSPGQMER